MLPKAIIIIWYHIVYVMIGIAFQLLLIISYRAFFLTTNRLVNTFLFVVLLNAMKRHNK